jgi:hypothetical protein
LQDGEAQQLLNDVLESSRPNDSADDAEEIYYDAEDGESDDPQPLANEDVAVVQNLAVPAADLDMAVVPAVDQDVSVPAAVLKVAVQKSAVAKAATKRHGRVKAAADIAKPTRRSQRLSEKTKAKLQESISLLSPMPKEVRIHLQQVVAPDAVQDVDMVDALDIDHQADVPYVEMADIPDVEMVDAPDAEMVDAPATNQAAAVAKVAAPKRRISKRKKPSVGKRRSLREASKEATKRIKHCLTTKWVVWDRYCTITKQSLLRRRLEFFNIM